MGLPLPFRNGSLESIGRLERRLGLQIAPEKGVLSLLRTTKYNQMMYINLISAAKCVTHLV